MSSSEDSSNYLNEIIAAALSEIGPVYRISLDSGVHEQTLWKWRANTHEPALSTLKRITDTYGPKARRLVLDAIKKYLSHDTPRNTTAFPGYQRNEPEPLDLPPTLFAMGPEITGIPELVNWMGPGWYAYDAKNGEMRLLIDTGSREEAIRLAEAEGASAPYYIKENNLGPALK